MAYVQLSDAASLGGSPDLTQAQLDQATGLVNSHLKRPEGLVFEVDANAQPICMAMATPTGTFSLQAAISPGFAVTVALSGPVAQIVPGDVLVADKGTATVEPLTVLSVSGQMVTFRQVKQPHAANAPLLAGLLITEQKPVHPERNTCRLSRLPLACLISGAGRYGRGRRSDRFSMPDPMSIITSINAIGGPPAWEVFEPARASIDTTSGAVWIGAGLLMAYYTEARLHYVAGWQASNIPLPIKQAVVRIANNIAGAGYGIPKQAEHVDGIGYTLMSGGKLANGGMVDASAEELLRPYRVLGVA